MRLTHVVRSGVVRAGVVVAVTAVAVLGFAAPASAHVTVNPSTATQGGFAKLTFRVPNEKATAGTVKLEVTFPENAPIASRLGQAGGRLDRAGREADAGDPVEGPRR